MSSITRLPFGKTGHESSRIIFGAAALAMMKQARADATLEMLHEFGVNHFDVAASYGEAELRLAPWLHDHRDEVFLATKTGERTREAAAASIERVASRLRIAACTQQPFLSHRPWVRSVVVERRGHVLMVADVDGGPCLFCAACGA